MLEVEGDKVKNKMEAARFYAPGNIKLEEIDIPKIDSHEILVKIKTSLICGTDVKMYKRGHPKNIVMLTADAFGIIPPISRLIPEQTLYHFISGYTSKIGGTEIGLGKEPQATFSACFGAPFMALHPYAYAQLLKEKILKHKVKCWLVNTGWVGGPYGIGSRIQLKYTRQMVKASLNGTLEKSSFVEEKIFGLKIPLECQGVPREILNPVKAWKNQREYMEKAKELAEKFKENFKQFAKDCDPEILEAGPKI